MLNLDYRFFVRNHVMMRSCLLKMVRFFPGNKLKQFFSLYKDDARTSKTAKKKFRTSSFYPFVYFIPADTKK